MLAAANAVPEVLGLRPGMLVCAMQPGATTAVLCGTVPANGIVQAGQSTLVFVQRVNAATGVSEGRYIDAACLSKPGLVFGRAVESVEQLMGLSCLIDTALSVHYARRAIAAIAASWPPKLPLTVDAFGSSENLVHLIKLVAASENTFGAADGEQSGDGATSTVSSAATAADSKTLQSLRRLLMKLLAHESSAFSGSKSRRSKQRDASDAGDSVSGVLLRECVSHFKMQSSGRRGSGSSGKRLTAESLHPYWHTCDYRGEVHLAGAKSIRVTFDHRCSLHGDSATLTLYSDKHCNNKLVRLSGGDWAPLVVHADKVYYRFVSDGKRAPKSGEKFWGYRFYVSAVSGLQWQHERQVLSDRSLEWASWLLRFLLKDVSVDALPASPSVATSHALVRSPSALSADITGGMVHNATVADAIVRYIRTPSMPFKARAVGLLAHLFKAPQLFPLEKLPDMATIHAMCACALQRCLTERSSSKQLFLPEGLLVFVELAVAAMSAQRVFDARQDLRAQQQLALAAGTVGEDVITPLPVTAGPSVGAAGGAGSHLPLPRITVVRTMSGVEARSAAVRLGIGTGFAAAYVDMDDSTPLLPPFEVSLPAPYMPAIYPLSTAPLAHPPKLAVEDLTALLTDVGDLMHCLVHGTRVPDRLLCRAWLDSLGHSDFYASSHPLFPSTHAVVPVDDDAGTLVLTGRLHVAGATRLLVQLDSRTAVPPGSSLVAKDSHGRVVTGFGGPNSTEWFTSGKAHCVVLDHTVTFEFTTHSSLVPAGTSLSSYWGLGISAYSDSGRTEDRTARVAGYEKLLAHKSDLERAVRDMARWRRDADAALVQYLNERADEVGKAAVSLPASELCLTREQFAFKFDLLDAFPLPSLQLRFALIRLLNYK